MRNFNKKGFTLIEMLIVVVIIGILAAALIPRLSSVKDRADDSSRKANLQQLVTAMSSYALDNDITKLATGYAGSDNAIITAALTGGGLKSVPTDPQNTSTTIFGVTTSGYAFFLGSKGGNASGTFVFISKAETAGAANLVECPGSTAVAQGTGLDILPLCNSVTINSAGPCSLCVATAASQLRIVSRY